MRVLNNGLLLNPQRLCVDTPAWTGHIPFAGWIMEELKPVIMVELGTHKGVSYSAFCQAVVENNLCTKCYAVDTWKGDEHASLYGEEIYTEYFSYHQKQYASFSQLMRMTFDEAAHYFSDGSIDLLHIDGFHSYEAVKNDFETWLPKMSDRGIMLFHDINVRERHFGVWTFWEEIRVKYPAFEFRHSHGLGVLLIGENIPENIHLFQKNEIGYANRLFPHLAESFYRANQIETLEQKLENQSTHIGNLERMLEDHSVHSANLEQMLSDQSTHIGNLEHMLDEKKDYINRLEQILEEKETLIKRLESTMQNHCEVETKLSDAEATIQMLFVTIKKIRSSFSWRITAPYRFLSQMVKKAG